MKATTIGFQGHGFWRPSRAICGLRLIGDGVGVVLFLMYAGVFGGFLWLNIFRPDLMAKTTVGEREWSLHGVNLNVVYGMGLILGAFLLALYYMRLVKRR